MKIKELLMKTQKVAYSTIYNSFKNHKTSHAYLIEGSNGTPLFETALFLAQSFFCQEDDLACEECKTCQRIKNGTYPDLLVLKNEVDGDVKVDDVKGLLENFSLTPIESDKKIYIIHEVEKIDPRLLNKILKFLEEPSNNIIAILTTHNLSRVLKTIVSRCQLIRLVNQSKNILMDELLKDFDLNDAYILSSLCNSKEEVEYTVSKLSYNSIKDMAYDTLRYMLEDQKHLLFHVMNNVERFIKEKELYRLFLSIIALYLKELLVNPDGDLTYRLKNKEDLDLEYALEQVLLSQYAISSYSNNGLVLDQLFTKIIRQGEENGRSN